MSKYRDRGPYHFIEFCDKKSDYHKHMDGLLSRIFEHMDRGKMSVIDIGCGEGLLINLLLTSGDNDVAVFGVDADKDAIGMAETLMPSVVFIHASKIEDWPEQFREKTYTIAVFSDSLEHIETWREHLEWAKQHAQKIIIAVPDRHDRHGLRDFKIDSFDEIFKDGWSQWLRYTENCRHVVSFEKSK